MLRHGLHSSCPAGTSRPHSRGHTHSSAACRQAVQQQRTPRDQQYCKLAAVPDDDIEFPLPERFWLDVIRRMALATPEDSASFRVAASGVMDAVFGEDADLVRQVLADQDNVAFPTAEELPVEMILQGMQREEAAQQQLMTEGKLADAARQGNTAISSILETHSKLQQLYHKALRALLERYGQIAVTPGGEWACIIDSWWY